MEWGIWKMLADPDAQEFQEHFNVKEQFMMQNHNKRIPSTKRDVHEAKKRNKKLWLTKLSKEGMGPP